MDASLAVALAPHGIAHDYSGGRIERIDLATGAVEILYQSGDHGVTPSASTQHCPAPSTKASGKAPPSASSRLEKRIRRADTSES